MQSPLVVYLVVAGASVVAGVAIASGSESSSETPVVESAPTDATDARASDPATTDDGEPDETGTAGPDATAPDEAEALDAYGDVSSDEDPPSTDAASAATTSSTTTIGTTTTTSTTVPLADRSVFPVFVANGANIAGVAGLTGDRLAGLGYGEVRRGDASEFVDESAVYVGVDLIPFGERLARDMGIDPSLVLPIDDMPEVGGVNDELLVVYLGRDVVDLLLTPPPDL